MTYSIGLEPVFHFSRQMILIAAGLVLAGALVLLVVHLLLKYDLKELAVVKKVRRWIRRLMMSPNKKKCLERIDRIEAGLKDGTYDKRKACQELSAALRQYVKNVTGLRAETYTASQVLKLGNEQLSTIFLYIYEPEFAFSSNRDAVLALERSRELIRSWK